MLLLSARRDHPFVSQVWSVWNEASRLPFWHNACRLHSASARTLFSSHLLSLFTVLLVTVCFEAIVMEVRASTSRRTLGNKAGEPSDYQIGKYPNVPTLPFTFAGKSASQADGPKELTLPGQVSVGVR